MSSLKERYSQYNRSIGGRFRQGVRSAKKRGIKFDLTRAEYRWLVEGARCTYCQGRLGKTGFGLDRIENRKGYCIQNAVPCCPDCNSIKGEQLTAYEMMAVAALLKGLRAEARTKRSISKRRRRK